VARVKAAKLKRLPAVRDLMRQMLVDGAASLDRVPANEQVVLGFVLVHHSWEDRKGLPQMITMQAPKQALVNVATRPRAPARHGERGAGHPAGQRHDRQAVEKRASDIHIEPFEKEFRIRFRVDGVLQDQEPPPRELKAAIISRVKLMAKLNIAERRLPQDGRIKIKTIGREVDLRVSTLPTLYGESVVMRLLDRSAGDFYDLCAARLRRPHAARMQHYTSLPHGIFLVTGPTGSAANPPRSTRR
jgi:hypothetical protein